MHLSTVAAAALMSLAALSPAEGVQTDRQPYRGHGTEPFWSVEIGSGTMRFEGPGHRVITAPRPRPIVGFNGELYQTRRMTVDITHVRCTDGMSDRTWHDTVKVTVDGRNYEGCGGEAMTPLRPIPIQGSWHIDSVAGRPTRGDSATIRFEGERISGNTGCNAFSGPFQLRRDTLTTGALMTTKRACIRFAATQEQDLLELLDRPLTVSEGRGGRLTLTAPGGRTIALSRERRD